MIVRFSLQLQTFFRYPSMCSRRLQWRHTGPGGGWVGGWVVGQEGDRRRTTEVRGEG